MYFDSGRAETTRRDRAQKDTFPPSAPWLSTGKTAPAPGGVGPLTPPPLIRPSLAEIRRVLARSLLAAARGIDHVLHWSLFRRLYQTRALISHYHRRGDPLPAELRM